MAYGLVIVVVLAVTAAAVGAANPCIPRGYGYDGTVCVCNATYCDFTDPLPTINFDQFIMFTSSLDGQRFNLFKGDFDENPIEEGVIFTLNGNTTYQVIKGFGGAFTDSTGINIASLSPEAQELLIGAYFGKGGNSYTFGRVPIGGTDFSTYPYTYSDDNLDPTFPKFNLSTEDYDYKIPYIKKAMEISDMPIRLLAAAWSAPAWMKTNNKINGRGSLKEEYYGAWADYIIKFLEEYDKNGLLIWALSTQNEPSAGDIPFYPFNCMGWTPDSQRIWVSQFMGPKLQLSRFNSTILMAFDDQRIELPTWLNLMFADGAATPFIEGIGVHWYWDNIAPAELLTKTHEAFPDKWILATEASFTKKLNEPEVVQLGSWVRGETYAESIMDDITNWAAGWVDWNLVLDSTGGPNWAKNEVDSAVIVNSTSNEFYKQPMFYAIGHFSKFVPLGSLRVGLTGGTDLVKGISFKTPDDLFVTVVLNKENQEKNITVVGVPQGAANFIVPAKSITTFITNARV